MTYNQAVEYIHSTLKFGQKLGLDNISYLLESMDNPQKQLQFIHVGGTNGKGSTCSYISSVLIEAGYQTGLFTSPYIEKFTERMKINNEDIPQDELADITCFVKSKVEEMTGNGYAHPTEFEIVTAIAMEYFKRQKCDVVVLEVGLGGRFDSTNVIEKPLVSVITSIDYDHTQILGSTLKEIAYEKAGIIKKKTDVVSYMQKAEAMEVITETARSKNCEINVLSSDCIEIVDRTDSGSFFKYEGNIYEIKNIGDFQCYNASLAILTLNTLKKFLNITDEDIFNGLKKAKWPARAEVISTSPLVIIDGGHNRQGAEVLRDTLEKWYPDKNFLFVFGVMKDKEYDIMIDTLIDLADEFYTVTANNDRALTAQEIKCVLDKKGIKATAFENIDNAVKRALETGKNICVCGSLYYVGYVRSIINNIL